MNHRRRSYQAGCLTTERRKTGDIWVYRYRESLPDGTRAHRSQIIGTVKEYPTRSAAQRACDSLRLEVNLSAKTPASPTLAEIVQHYRAVELGDDSSKSQRTKEVYEYQLSKVILPTWGAKRPTEVKPRELESWLRSLPVSNGSRSKTKGVLSIVFKHAMRYEFATVNRCNLFARVECPARNTLFSRPSRFQRCFLSCETHFAASCLRLPLEG